MLFLVLMMLCCFQAWWFVTEGQFYTDLWYRCNVTCKEIPGSATADAGKHSASYAVLYDVIII